MVSDLCSDAAEKHSSDMGNYGFFSHTTQASDFFKLGSDAGDRLVMCGYHFDSWGECIAAGYSSAAGVLKAWQGSTSGHNEMMLRESHRVIGIALVHVAGSPYGYYWTADFGGSADVTAHWVDEPGPSTTSTTTTVPSTTTTTNPPATTTTTTQVAGTFVDVPASSAYYDAITSLAAAGVVSGYQDGMFLPEHPVTRAQFAKMVILALDKHSAEIDNAAAPSFPDVRYTGSDYPFDYIEEAVGEGIIQGFGDGTFGPCENVTRLQLALMLVRAGGGGLVAPPPGYQCSFHDVPRSVRDQVGIAAYNGLLSGRTATFFDCYGIATRGHVAKMVYGLLQVLSD